MNYGDQELIFKRYAEIELKYEAKETLEAMQKNEAGEQPAFCAKMKPKMDKTVASFSKNKQGELTLPVEKQ